MIVEEKSIFLLMFKIYLFNNIYGGIVLYLKNNNIYKQKYKTQTYIW